MPGVTLAGTLHADIGLDTTALELEFDVTGELLTSNVHLVGALSAAPDGFDLFATGTVQLPSLPGVSLAATLDVGRESPFFLALVARDRARIVA